MLAECTSGACSTALRPVRRYLADRYPEKGLFGTDARSRAAVDNWMEAEAHNLDPYTGVCQGLS